MSHETRYLQLTARDPLIVRDGRPFGFGQRMKTLPWLTPTLVAGSLRSSLGKSVTKGQAFDDELRSGLQKIGVSPAFPAINGQLFFPAPQDAIATYADNKAIDLHRIQLAPLSAGEGIFPAIAQSTFYLDHPSGKRAPLPSWWSFKRLTQWLLEVPYGEEFWKKEFSTDKGFWTGPKSETRTHVSLGKAGVAEDGHLFQTQGLVLTLPTPPHQPIALSVRFHWPTDLSQSDTESRLRQILENKDKTNPTWPRQMPMGGEHRAVHAEFVQPHAKPCGWNLDDKLKKQFTTSLKGAKYVRMMLTSPAYFAAGSQPSWINDQGEGYPPSAPALKLKLLAATVPCWQAVSGWSYAHRAPKRTHRVVPAGAVYFFEVIEGDASVLADAWMKPMGDPTPNPAAEAQHASSTITDQLSNDGYGLAVWGVATPRKDQP